MNARRALIHRASARAHGALATDQQIALDPRVPAPAHAHSPPARGRAAGPAAPDADGALRAEEKPRGGCVGCWRMTGTGWVGAMLYRGAHSDSSDTVSKYASTSCFLRDNR